jgi:N-[(2S)-2-amino-2-carboxyethyl]-L-glutamate dehydrogenase
MDKPVLRLGVDDVWRVIKELDPIELRMAKLAHLTAAGGCGTGDRAAKAAEQPEEDLVLIEDPGGVDRCAIPWSILCLCHAAMTVALAAEELLAHGETTVGLLASGEAAHFHLTTIACHLPGVGQVYLTSASDQGPAPVDARVLDLFDRAGIELSVVTTVDEATRGANLLITTGPGHDDLVHRHLPRGALLVNVAGLDMPANIVDRVDQIYVDDLGLLERNRHRRFVTVHLDRLVNGRRVPLRKSLGWQRDRSTWFDLRRIEADFGQVISGRRPGRTNLDDVLLFELLGVRELDVALAEQIHRTARACGLGV